MLTQRFRLRIPEGFMVEDVENGIIKNKHLIKK